MARIETYELDADDPNDVERIDPDYAHDRGGSDDE